jgi:hypothetical protein
MMAATNPTEHGWPWEFRIPVMVRHPARPRCRVNSFFTSSVYFARRAAVAVTSSAALCQA